MRSAAFLYLFTRPPWPLLFSTATLGMILSACRPHELFLPALCTSIAVQSAGLRWIDVIRITVELNSPISMLVDWALMLVAMMPPLLAMPLMHTWNCSLPTRRVRALAMFLLGYCLVWLMAGPLLLALAIFLMIAQDNALVITILLALLWSATPWQRLALNRGHQLRRIGLFGWRAQRDCVKYGINHGWWCLASCWAWMIVPLLAVAWHEPVMMLSSGLMFTERLMLPKRPTWRMPVQVVWLWRLVRTRINRVKVTYD